MYNNVKGFLKPKNILQIIDGACVEMNDDEHDFLCDMIRTFCPSKMLEVGVAAGGTTAVIMNCLSMVNPKCEMYSVDISRECYRKKGFATGYQLEQVKEYLPNYDNHHFFLGKELPYVIDAIGKDIDFVVLDTVHSMPGEILDFLCVLPYLSKNAIIVLHDVVLNMLNGSHSYATKVLFDTVAGEKYWNCNGTLSNIAAFRIIEDTFEHIENVFSSLTISWEYLPSLKSLGRYYNNYKNYYSTNTLSLFRIIVPRQVRSFMRIQSIDTEEDELIQELDKNKEIYIYGTGLKGLALGAWLERKRYSIKNYVVSDDYIINRDSIIRPVRLSLVEKEKSLVILASFDLDCFWNLAEDGYDFVVLSDLMWDRIINDTNKRGVTQK